MVKCFVDYADRDGVGFWRHSASVGADGPAGAGYCRSRNREQAAARSKKPYPRLHLEAEAAVQDLQTPRLPRLL